MAGAPTRVLNRRSVLRYTGAATTTAGLAPLARITGARAQQLDEITITLSQFPDTIDPLDHITGDYFDVYDHLYEPLFDFEPGEGTYPRVTENWEAQGDATTRVELRDDVVFHNGDDLTAEDVAWTIDPEIGVPSPIGTFGLGSITDAEAVDDHTLDTSSEASPGLAAFEREMEE